MKKEHLESLQNFMIEKNLELSIKPTVTGKWFAELFDFANDCEVLYIVEDSLPEIFDKLFIKITN